MSKEIDLIEEYFTVDMTYKQATKQRKELNEKIKVAFDIGDFEVDTKLHGKVKVSNRTHDRTSMNDEKIVALMKELGHTGAIKTIEVVDKDALNDLIFQGIILANQLEGAVDVSEVRVLRVTKIK